MTPEEAIRANAELVIDQFTQISPLGEEFGYNRESIEWVAGFIERERERTDAEKDSRQSKLTQVISANASFRFMAAPGRRTRTVSGLSR